MILPGFPVSADVQAARFTEPRLRVRLPLILADLEGHLGCSLPQACGDWAATQGAYRFLAHPQTAVDNLLPAFTLPAARAACRRDTVVDVHDRVAPAGGAGGRQGERGQEVVDGGLRVRQEAVGALGGRPVATGLRQGAPQVAFQVGQNQRQTDAQTRLREARGLDVGRHGKTGEDHVKLRSRRTPFLLAYPAANASTSPCVRVSLRGGEGLKRGQKCRYAATFIVAARGWPR